MYRTTYILLCLILYIISFGGCVWSTEETTEQPKALEPLFYSTIDFYSKLLRTTNGVYLDGYRIDKNVEDQGTFCSTAAVGIGLVALCVDHELGRDPQAQQKALETLRAINGKLSGFQMERDSTGYFHHFFDSQDGAGMSEYRRSIPR